MSTLLGFYKLKIDWVFHTAAPEIDDPKRGTGIDLNNSK